MLLNEYLVSRGSVLFRWRSYTPLLLIPLLVLERHTLTTSTLTPPQNTLHEALYAAIVLLGVLIRAKTIGHVAAGTSGRNTTRQVAEALNETGTYSVVRNPLYVGNYFILLGVSLMAESLPLAIINTFLFAAAYLPIILTEEQFLAVKFGDKYRAYADRVPCMLPNLGLWKPPSLPFSARMVLRREHDTWMSSIAGLSVMAIYRESMLAGSFQPQGVGSSVLVAALAVWLVFKAVKLWTPLLSERPQPAAKT